MSTLGGILYFHFWIQVNEDRSVLETESLAFFRPILRDNSSITSSHYGASGQIAPISYNLTKLLDITEELALRK